MASRSSSNRERMSTLEPLKRLLSKPMADVFFLGWRDRHGMLSRIGAARAFSATLCRSRLAGKRSRTGSEVAKSTSFACFKFLAFGCHSGMNFVGDALAGGLGGAGH